MLRRHIERSSNLGLSPQQIVEVFVLLTFNVGVPAMEAVMRITKEVFVVQGVQGRCDRQIRVRIEGALRVGVTPD